jgi:hypothetical protein
LSIAPLKVLIGGTADSNPPQETQHGWGHVGDIRYGGAKPQSRGKIQESQ